MRNKSCLLSVVLFLIGCFFSCTNNPTQANSIKVDKVIPGKWHGAFGLLVPGIKIFATIDSSLDSTFTLVTRDTARDTTKPFKDTTLILTGTWRLKPAMDTIVLTSSDSFKIIDTARAELVTKAATNPRIPIKADISENSGIYTWNIFFPDLLPVAGMLGITIPPNFDLSGISIELEKITP
jgi:hypothetical protein